MFKNYFKIAFKVLLRRKMFSFISLFGICLTLTILLCSSSLYTFKVISNPIEKNLSRTLYVNWVTFAQKNKADNEITIGPVMAYFIEAAIKPLDHVEMVSFCSTNTSNTSIYQENKRLDIDTKETDENFFNALNFKFLEGRPYSKKEIMSGEKVAVICFSLKQRLFENQASVGKQVTIDDVNYRIVGVVKDVPKIFQTPYSQLWKPYNYASYMSEVNKKELGTFHYVVMVIAKNSNYFDAIKSQFKQKYSWLTPKEGFDEISSVMETSFDHNIGTQIYSNDEPINNDASKDHLIQVFILISVLSLFLTIPLLNLMNLTVSRIFERTSEIGVRKAFGANKRQMIIQFLYENLIITTIGGLLGFVGSYFLIKGIDASGMMEIGALDMNYQVFVVGFAVIFLFSLATGLIPALRMSKLQITDCLKGGNQ